MSALRAKKNKMLKGEFKIKYLFYFLIEIVLKFFHGKTIRFQARKFKGKAHLLKNYLKFLSNTENSFYRCHCTRSMCFRHYLPADAA